LGIDFHIVAVTPEQIEEMNLPTRPTKSSDTRSAGFGDESVELDAIEPDALRQMVDKALQSCFPRGALQRLRRQQEREREQIRERIRERLKDEQKKRTPRFRGALFVQLRRLSAHQLPLLRECKHCRIFDTDALVHVVVPQHPAGGDNHATDVNQRHFPIEVAKVDRSFANINQHVGGLGALSSFSRDSLCHFIPL
jgi:hypothetical protein